ncbi:tryptophan transporter [Halanaerobaculum tunisiense]
MELRKFVEASLLLAGGFVLHQIMPPIPIGAGMRPDMSLLMLFIIIGLYQNKKLTLLSGVVTGIISALTTTFPGGQIPNLIDKPITGFVVLGLFLVADKLEIPTKFSLAIIGSVGTIVSGGLFLGSAYLIVELPKAFAALFSTVVLPAVLLNTAFMYALYPLIVKIKGSLSTIELDSNNKAA